ncbi:AraC family transcriptional regulator [Pseudoalteromonas sp. MMG010]|uniref:AraC family transcriptional regulator n=1 Tax=Pseudoalteromonas sp. MMG010 TaxID=2822685 RepID=UPI001B39FC65|nr:AraC family transcriptional regulator [Pseudoalteromonas sp. MMG010]MBQ4834463.1 AraC family transcriptional regulator [Pseudoalteromonas sp. MMG010]
MKNELATFYCHKPLGDLEVLKASYTHQNFARHSHEGYTIGLIDTGAQKFLRNGCTHIAPENSIILVNADEIHNGQTATKGGWAYKAMYPKPQQFESLSQEISGIRCGAPYFDQAVSNNPLLIQQLKLLLTNLTETQTVTSQLYQESLFYNVMTLLMLAFQQKSRQLKPLANNVNLSQAQQYLDAYCCHEISLECLAKLACMSPYHFIRQFKKQFGLTPHAYQIHRRVLQAKVLLKHGLNISQTATECGFHDQSHLHHQFKSRLGVTPGQYRNLFKPKLLNE